MISKNYQIFLPIGIVGSFTNTFTIIYLLRNYNIAVHVYTLIFIDSLISTTCSFTMLFYDSLVFSQILTMNFWYCTISQLTIFLPMYWGSILTCMVAIIRYVLAQKAAKNIQVSNFKVSLLAIAGFCLVIAVTFSFFAFNICSDIPYTFYVESCMIAERTPRSVPMVNVIALRSGIFFNVTSVIVDILMLKFIKKTILAINSGPSEASGLSIEEQNNCSIAGT
jgi:hypothetical protein